MDSITFEKIESEHNAKFFRYAADTYDQNYGFNPNVNSNTSDDSIVQSLVNLRRQTDEFYANNIIYHSIVENISDFILGKGFSFTCDTPDKKLNKAVEKHLQKYLYTTDVDASDKRTIDGLLESVVKSWLISGESFSLFVGRENEKYQTKVRLLDTTSVDSTDDAAKNVRLGIVFDRYGVERYLLVNEGKPKPTKYPFKDSESGDRLISHVLTNDYTIQSHGVPLMVSALKQILDLNIAQKSEIRALANASQINILVKSNNPNQVIEQFNRDAQKQGLANTPANSCETVRKVMAVRPDLAIPLSNSDTIEQFKLDRGSFDVNAFILENIKRIVSTTGFAYEVVFKAFADSNYSSAKASLIQSYQRASKYHREIINNFLRPLLNLFIKELYLTDKIKTKLSLDDILDGIKINPPPIAVLDPMKEIQGLVNGIDAGIMSKQLACDRMGNGDYFKILSQIQTEKAEEKALLGDNAESIRIEDQGRPANENSTKG